MEIDQENNNSLSTSYQRKRCYRQLLNRIEGLQESDDVGIQAVKEVGEILKEVNLIDDQCVFTERVEYADETLLESVVLSSASGILVKCIEKLDIFTSTYEASEFASKIINAVQGDDDEFKDDHWLNILEDAHSIVPDLPTYSFLYGTFDPTKVPQPKSPVERAKRQPQERVEKVQLQQVVNADKDEEGMEDTVDFLARVLKIEYEKNKSEPIGYYEFVIDSSSFNTTVENMFYCAFLIRDGKARLQIGPSGVPTIKPVHKSELKAFRQSGGVNVQMITSITMDQWQASPVKMGFIQKYRKKLQSKT